MGGPRNRGFPVFWFGQAVSQFGDEITLLALPWLLAETTASPLAVGALEAFSFLPVLVFGLAAGVVADRRSRRRSMLDADATRFVLYASIPVAAWLSGDTLIAHVLVVAFCAGTARILFEASSQAFLPDLLKGQGLVHANSRLSMTEGLAIVLGPPVAGVLVAAFGAATAVALDSLTFLASFVAIACMTRVDERLGRREPGEGFGFTDGLTAIRANRIIATSTLINSCANVASGMTAAMLVFFLQRTLGLSGLQAGLVIGANGVGVLAAGRIGRLSSKRFGLGRTIVVGQAVAATGVVTLAAAAGAYAAPIAAGGLALLGFGVIMTIVASVSLRQYLVAGPLLGRVTATYRTSLHGAMALGAFASGAVGEFVGVREALWVAASIFVLVALAAFMSPLRRRDSEGLTEAT